MRDSDDESDSATVDITVTAVNDVPVITDPPGSNLSQAITETAYEFQLTATDEEDSILSIFNFSILSCSQNYISNSVVRQSQVVSYRSGGSKLAQAAVY